MAKKSKKRAMNFKELGNIITDVMSERYRQMEKVFGNVEEPMMKAIRVGSEPIANEIREFMAQHHRSGDTIGSFTPGVVLYDAKAEIYYFKLGFDVKKGGWPALILEYGDKGSPMRMPNQSYFFMHWANKNNIEGVYGAIQDELDKLLKEAGR